MLNANDCCQLNSDILRFLLELQLVCKNERKIWFNIDDVNGKFSYRENESCVFFFMKQCMNWYEFGLWRFNFMYTKPVHGFSILQNSNHNNNNKNKLWKYNEKNHRIQQKEERERKKKWKWLNLIKAQGFNTFDCVSFDHSNNGPKVKCIKIFSAFNSTNDEINLYLYPCNKRIRIKCEVKHTGKYNVCLTDNDREKERHTKV